MVHVFKIVFLGGSRRFYGRKYRFTAKRRDIRGAVKRKADDLAPQMTFIPILMHLSQFHL